MSETRRRQRPQLQVPQREDAELDMLSRRMDELNQQAIDTMSQPDPLAGITGRAVRTAEEEEAYNLGAKMGAQALAGTGGYGQQTRRRMDEE